MTLKSNIFDFKMLSHETILKSKDTEKCMTRRQVFLENYTEK